MLAKRDDAIPFGFGGNKVRKLEFVVAQALTEGAAFKAFRRACVALKIKTRSPRAIRNTFAANEASDAGDGAGDSVE